MRKLLIYVCSISIVLMMSWEYQRSVAASIMTESIAIPQDSIRLRVLAHSDTPQDQWLKREVRDVVVQQMSIWAEEAKNIDEARGHIESGLVDLNQLVQEEIRRRGFTYTSHVEYGQITFPSKLYGNQYYPAGEYEGLLITIGAGQGENWWCVLFPPLCFVDFGTGEVLDPEEVEKEQQDESLAAPSETEGEIEIKFFVLELLNKVKALFA
jgi:stage II sporulation protein R